MARVTHAVNVPIITGENLYGRHGFRKLIETQACDGVHLDIPKLGGLLEAKRISDFADQYAIQGDRSQETEARMKPAPTRGLDANISGVAYIWSAAHNPASPVGTIASVHAAASMRNFRIHELANYVSWWPDLVIKEGPFWEKGYFIIQDKPGYGVEINPDVAKAHLAPGEVWWG